ncbi:MAG: sugar-binding domain-containing protein [Flavobacteriaceae bacterium]
MLFKSLIISAQDFINLSGKWQFKLDPENVGVNEKWYENFNSENTINLPGCLQEQGYGNIPNSNTQWWAGTRLDKWFAERPWLSQYKDSSNFKIQEYLVPKRHYIGVAWYALQITIPPTWQNNDIELFLERCHWESQLWVNGKTFGVQNSLGTPHVYTLKNMAPGIHNLVVRIDNSEIVNLGKMAHSVSEQTAGTWNGIVGKLELRKLEAVQFNNIQLYPNIEEKTVTVKGEIINAEQLDRNCKLHIEVAGVNQNRHKPKSIIVKTENVILKNNTFEVIVPMGNKVELWNEFHPNLYSLQLTLTSKKTTENIRSKDYRFGMRQFASEGTQFSINGTKTFLRGNVDCAVFPKTGYAPMDVASWKKLWQVYKEFGLNMARFHSWCPPEAAFIAADEVGIYLAPEVGEWTKVKQQDQFDFLKAEADNILNTYGNYASFIQLGMGNEANGDNTFFKETINHWKAKDSRHLYTIKANSNANPDNIDYEVVRGAGTPFQHMRYQIGWPPKPLNSAFQSTPPNTTIHWENAVNQRKIPLIQHETAQICAYPDVVAETKKYTGYLKPTYLEIAKNQLIERGLLEQLPDFVNASGKWQYELTKEEFEAAYRTKGLAGYHWLSLNDFTGQDTAPVGFTDAFYNTKPYIDPETVRQWIAPTVLLATLEKRVFSSEEKLDANILVSHFGAEHLDLQLTVSLIGENGKSIQQWQLNKNNIGQGNAQFIGSISGTLANFKTPTHLILKVEANSGLKNQWDIWVFPEISKIKDYDFIISDTLNADVEAQLKQGKTVLLLPKQKQLKGELPICFTNYYWTSFGESGGQSSASGVLIQNGHPVFRDFPTENHPNWQWYDLLTYAHPMILHNYDNVNPWPAHYKPIIQPIDTWKINRKLGLLVEAKVGNGKLIICSIDLETDIENRPVAKQFKQNLFNYIGSAEFNPTTVVDLETVRHLFN